jgi:competence protein ComEA
VQRHAFRSKLIALALPTFAAATFAAAPGPTRAPAPAGHASAAQAVKPIDINSASRAQLKTLPGIGDAEADKIIAGRPYLSKADLATKNVLATGIVLSIKHRIIAIQKAGPKVKQ